MVRPKLWYVKLMKPLAGNLRTLQVKARELGLQQEFRPVVIPNLQYYNDVLSELGDMVSVTPLIIAPSAYPYADHPKLGANGVYYPSPGKVIDINLKYGDTSHLIQWPESTPPAVKADILAKYEAIFGESRSVPSDNT